MKRLCIGLALLVSGGQVFGAAAQEARSARPFPFEASSQNAPSGARVLLPRPGAIEALAGESQLLLVEVPLPEGTVELALERVPVNLEETIVHVNGEVDPRGLPLANHTLWRGQLVGVEGSDVMLSFSPHGSYGWIHNGERRFELSARPDPELGWRRPIAWLFEAGQSTEAPVFSCATDDLQSSVVDGPTPTPRHDSGQPASNEILECPIAIETDYQLFTVFNDLTAEQAYVAALIGAVSGRFLEQVNVVLTYPYLAFYTNPNDPWISQDNGGGCGDVLTEFRNAWAGNIPAGAALGHFLSGAWLGCGVAWLDVLCNESWGFSLSCCINGGVTFPVTQGSNTWDFFVMAHELGHNFGSPHTQDFCPPLDKCVGNCTGTTECTNQGTNMSYCHGCPGGMNNITTYFHPTVVDLMRQEAENSCLETICKTESYCVGAANSYWGSGAHLSSSGSTSISVNDLVLEGTNAVPNQFALFFYGPDQVQIPFGDGYRCVGAGGIGLFRLPPPQPCDAWGYVYRAVDLTQPPANGGLGEITAGSSWNFQLWYRDPGGVTGFNLSDGLSVIFCP